LPEHVCTSCLAGLRLARQIQLKQIRIFNFQKVKLRRSRQSIDNAPPTQPGSTLNRPLRSSHALKIEALTATSSITSPPLQSTCAKSHKRLQYIRCSEKRT
jgi:hypothetical protein